MTRPEQTELARRMAEKSVADRCRMALLSHEGFGPTEIAERVGLHVASVDRLLKRLRKERLAVLHDKPRPGRPRSISPVTGCARATRTSSRRRRARSGTTNAPRACWNAASW